MYLSYSVSWGQIITLSYRYCVLCTLISLATSPPSL